LKWIGAKSARGGNPPVAWYAAHELFVYNPATHQSTKIAGIDGVSVPTWSADGKSLLYVSRNALWLSPATGGKPTEIATPLFAPAEWLHPGLDAISYYGQINWTGQFDWRSP
jgi:Tol biopolymer transport system component